MVAPFLAAAARAAPTIARYAGRAATALTVGKAVKGVAGKLKPKKKSGILGKALKIGGAVAAVGAAGYAIEQVAEKMGVRGGAGFIGKDPTKNKRFRRINPTNVKALKRSTKRLAAFDKVADSVKKELGKIAPRPKQRHTSGVITQSEALRALRN